MSTNAEVLATLAERFAQPDPATLATLPKGGANLLYMGHAEVTLALLEADPLWTWEPLAFDASGLPMIDVQGNRLTMWGYLTVCGLRRLCVGTCEARKGDPEKELIGDLLRNGAMRFGIGTKLWSKATDADPAVERSGGYDSPKRAKATPALKQKVGDELAKRVADEIAASPGVVQFLREIDTERRGFGGEALDDPTWARKVESALADYAVAEASMDPLP